MLSHRKLSTYFDRQSIEREMAEIKCERTHTHAGVKKVKNRWCRRRERSDDFCLFHRKPESGDRDREIIMCWVQVFSLCRYYCRYRWCCIFVVAVTVVRVFVKENFSAQHTCMVCYSYSFEEYEQTKKKFCAQRWRWYERAKDGSGTATSCTQ